MGNGVKSTFGFRRLAFSTLSVIMSCFSLLLILCSYAFGTFARGGEPTNIIDMINRVIRLFNDFSWLNILYAAAIVVYVIIVVKTVKVLIDEIKATKGYFVAITKNRPSEVFKQAGESRGALESAFVLYIIYVIQGAALSGEYLSTLGSMALYIGVVSFVITNLTITYSSEKLPDIEYLLVDLARMILIPVFIILMFNHINVVGVYQSVGYGFSSFFAMNLEGVDGTLVFQMVYTTFGEPTFKILLVTQMIFLCITCVDNMFQCNEPNRMYGKPPKDKFFGLVKILAVWIIVRCIIYTFFVGGFIDIDVFKIIEKWFALIRNDLLPLILISIGGGVLLIPKYVKQYTRKHKKHKNHSNEAEPVPASVVNKTSDTAVKTQSAGAVKQQKPKTVNTASVFNTEAIDDTPYDFGISEDPKPKANVGTTPSNAASNAFCSGCGKPISANDVFCSGCGKKLK